MKHGRVHPAAAFYHHDIHIKSKSELQLMIIITEDSSVDYFLDVRSVVWLIKCQKRVKKKLKMTSLNVSFCPQLKHVQF